MDPPHAIELENGRLITYASAQEDTDDILLQQRHVEDGKELYTNLFNQRHIICSLVRHHLNLGDDERCRVLPQNYWLEGSFNVCIPVETVSGTVRRTLMFRCCLPYKPAETQYPGTIDEKLGCEVGTYAWMQQHCADVRIPHLYGFGFTDHRHYSHENHRPWYLRLWRKLQRRLNDLLGRDLLSYYTPNPSPHQLPTAYMLLEHIGPDKGQMLSTTWSEQRGDLHRRKRLFRGVARAMLSLARVPQPRIGSFQFHDDCRVRLTNRPLTCTMMIFENEGTPRTIQRMETYSSTERFASDMLSYHDNRLLSQQNIASDDTDCRGGMAVRTLLRALLHKNVKKEFRDGPFPLQFTDLHASNMFVDKDWNVTCFMDLEWVSALPVEMLAVPYWLTGCEIDELKGENLDEYSQVRQEFMHILEEEEDNMATHPSIRVSRVMEDMWKSKGVWFWYCLESVNAMSWLVLDHICPQYGAIWPPSLEAMLSNFWCEDSRKIVDMKLKECEAYNKALEHAFKEPPRSQNQAFQHPTLRHSPLSKCYPPSNGNLRMDLSVGG